MEVALQDDAVFLQRAYYDRDNAFAQARALGVTRLRVNMPWAMVVSDASAKTVPRKPVYDWAPYDDLVATAAQNGIKVQLTLSDPAPAFATGNHRIGAVRPNASLYARFVRHVVDHFRGRVDRYSIWNEPNWISHLAPAVDAPRLYRALYAAGYRAAKAADPTAQVMFGELAPRYRARLCIPPLQFVRAVLGLDAAYGRTRATVPLRTDGFALHPYDFEHPPDYRIPGNDNVTISTLDRLTSALSRMASARVLLTPAGRAPDVFLTEFGYFGTGRRAISQARRNNYLRRGFQIAAANPRVREMLQYLLVRPPTDSPSAFFDTAIVGLRGKPMPAFLGLASWARSAARQGRIAKPGE
jgi:hypothetical protein